MRLRDYQQEAVDAALSDLGQGKHPVLQLATGTGKSVIISAVANHYAKLGKRVWVLTHIAQLVKQNSAAFRRYTDKEPGIACSGLNRKDTDNEVTFGTIQTIIGMLPNMPPPDFIIIDEAHRVPHNEGEPSLYESVLSKYPDALRLAMTATPWRMDNGIIYGSGKSFWFDTLSYIYPVSRAVEDGWLSPLVGVDTEVQLDTEGVSVTSGDFVQVEAGSAETDGWLTKMAESILKLAHKRDHIAVYCPTVDAATRAGVIIERITGWSTDILHSGLSADSKEFVLEYFYSGATRVLCSVDMITTGFDFPALDCIVCLRPTLSSSLWVQVQGRGTRPHHGKKNCLVLDYVGNLTRLGGVGMCETYYREKGLVEVEAVPTKPYIKKERKVYPGVRTLEPIDPVTGKPAGEGSMLKVEVHHVNSIAITTRRNPNIPVLMVQYACTTPEGVRIDATKFVNTEIPTTDTLEFFNTRSLAVNLPSPARSLTWQLKGARQPKHASVYKSGRYWTIAEEYFN